MCCDLFLRSELGFFCQFELVILVLIAYFDITTGESCSVNVYFFVIQVPCSGF